MNKEQFIATLQACYFGDKGAYNKILSLYDENEKLNHYKLLYQKVKDRNDKAIEYLEQELEYSKKDCVPARGFTCEKALKILKGNNETKE